MINKVYLVGRVGKDVETFQFENGNSKASFSLATNESWKDKDGEWQERTEWHNVVSFGKYADKLAERVVKGSLVAVEGKISTRSYEDSDGNKRYITEIIGDSIKLLKKPEDTDAVQPDQNAETPTEEPAAVGENEDDLPF